MASLLDLSHEMLHGILINVDPADLAALCQTCAPFNAYIKGNRLLCKDLYLQRWDHPAAESEPCWETMLRKLGRLEKLLKSHSTDAKRQDLEFAASTIIPMLDSRASALNVPWLAEQFESQDNIDCLLAASSLFDKAGTASQGPAQTDELRQLAAKLHCLYGVPLDEAPSTCALDDAVSSRFRSPYHIIYPSHHRADSVLTRSQTQKHPSNHVARAKVYDLREYTDGSFWGPFKDDGRQTVDWEKVEAVMVVLGYNMRLFCDRARGIFAPMWDKPWDGAGTNTFVSPPPPPKIGQELGVPGELEERDPYGVTGMWMRVVCFLDYNDLYAFNFGTPIPASSPRQPIDTKEALRMIELALRVTRISAPGRDDGQQLPVVHFRGTSRSLHQSWDPNANSKIRGTVRQTPAGDVRWTTWSIFHGEERWRSEGIQVGGLRSARGVLGNWFDKDYDVHGPAGPTAFWKVSDHLVEQRAGAPGPPPGYPLPYLWEVQDDSDED